MPDTIVHDPENTTVIRELFVFLSVDEKGYEGICGMPSPLMGTMPMVTGDIEIVRNIFQPFAKEMSAMTDKKIRLAKFSTRQNIEVY
jgi:hypothetical protein